MTTALQTTNRKKIIDLLTSEAVQKQIALAAPKHLTAERIVRVALTAFQRTPALLECTQMSLLGCVMTASQLGLELDDVRGLAYMVPFNNKQTGQKEAQLIPGYKGLIQLAYNSDRVTAVYAHAVYEGDHFEVKYGLDHSLEHVPNWDNRGKEITFVYGVVKMTGEQSLFAVMSWAEVMDHKDKFSKAKNSGPWVTNTVEMAKKTVIRQALKLAPLSPMVHRAVALDERAETPAGQRIDLELDPAMRIQETTAEATEALKNRVEAANGREESEAKPAEGQENQSETADEFLKEEAHPAKAAAVAPSGSRETADAGGDKAIF